MTSPAKTLSRPAPRVVGLAAIGVFASLFLATAASSTLSARPTKAEIEAETRAAVRASHSRLVSLRVVTPNRAYSLTVGVRDPAAYLKYRFNTLVRVVNRLTTVQWRFRTRYIAVVDRSSNRVFWVKQVRTAGRQSSQWFVRRGLEDCVRNVELDIGSIDPDHVAPPCAA